MKNKKGFTLIELLAVIIILGVLMIIAVPSVTKYIDGSRKSGYVSTAKNIIGGARNLVYSGELDLSDTKTTYYIDGKCISTDNGYKSPYGDITKSYVAVVLEGDNYEYYWMSVDDTNTGVEMLKNADDLENSDIVGDINPESILPNIGIDKRKTIVKIEGEECRKSAPETATRKMNTKTGKITDPCPAVTETIYWALQDTNSDSVADKLVLSDSVVSGLDSGSFSGNTYFVSTNNVPWVNTSQPYGSSNLSLYVSEIEITGNIVPASMAFWFIGVGMEAPTFTANLNNINVCHVTSMYSTFEDTGANASSLYIDLSDWDTSNVTNMEALFCETGMSSTSWEIKGIEDFDTSKVTNMSYLFESAANAISEVNWDLSNWDTSKVTNMEYLFSEVGVNASSFNLNINTWNTSNVTDMSYMFFKAGKESSIWNVKGLSSFNTSNVTNMGYMLSYTAKNVENIDIYLSGWDTSKVTNINSLFESVGYNARTVNIDVSNFNTENVKFMGTVFRGVGYNADTVNIDLRNFNTSKADNISSMFNINGYAAGQTTITIPRTNGNGLNNTTSRIYGKSSILYSTPPTGVVFTLSPDN